LLNAVHRLLKYLLLVKEAPYLTASLVFLLNYSLPIFSYTTPGLMIAFFLIL